MCLVCQQPSPEEGNYSEKRPFIPNTLSVSLKMPRGLHTETLQHNLARGKGADDAPDNEVTGGCREVPATSQAAHALGNQKLSSWRGTKSLCHVCSGSSPAFLEKKYLTFQGCVYHHPGVFPLYKLDTPLAASQENSQEQNQAVVPAVRHRLRSPLELRTFASLFSCKGKYWV